MRVRCFRFRGNVCRASVTVLPLPYRVTFSTLTTLYEPANRPPSTGLATWPTPPRVPYTVTVPRHTVTVPTTGAGA